MKKLQANIFHCPIFTALSARSLVFEGKLCFWDFRRVKNNTSNLRRILIFCSEKRENRRVLNSTQYGIIIILNQILKACNMGYVVLKLECLVEKIRKLFISLPQKWGMPWGGVVQRTFRFDSTKQFWKQLHLLYIHNSIIWERKSARAYLCVCVCVCVFSKICGSHRVHTDRQLRTFG